MPEPIPQSINFALIQKQGRQIIHQLRQDLDKSDSLLIGDDARNKIFKRAKTLVEEDRSGLRLVEKGMLLQYVRDGIDGQVDPDARLTTAANAMVKVSGAASSNYVVDASQKPSIYSGQAKLYGAFVTLILIFAAVGLNSFKANSRRALHHFATPAVSVKKDDNIDYRTRLERKAYYVYVPKTYDPKKPAGLMVYISSKEDVTEVPAGWADVLDAHNIIFIAPQDAGNHGMQAKRLGLGVLGALAAMREYKIDPTRVFAAGISGGARTASGLAFLQPDLFTGTVQSCGADYYKTVPHVKGANWVDSNGNRYGIVEASDDEVKAAKANVKFLLATGPGDSRYGNLYDIYEGGYLPDGFKCKLIDDPKMGHQDCSPQSLEQALSFLDSK